MYAVRTARSSRGIRSFQISRSSVATLREGDIFAYNPKIVWTSMKFVDSAEWVRVLSRTDEAWGYTFLLDSLLSEGIRAQFTARFGPYEEVIVVDNITDEDRTDVSLTFARSIGLTSRNPIVVSTSETSSSDSSTII